MNAGSLTPSKCRLEKLWRIQRSGLLFISIKLKSSLPKPLWKPKLAKTGLFMRKVTSVLKFISSALLNRAAMQFSYPSITFGSSIAGKLISEIFKLKMLRSLSFSVTVPWESIAGYAFRSRPRKGSWSKGIIVWRLINLLNSTAVISLACDVKLT